MEEQSKEALIRELAEQHLGWKDYSLLGAGLPFDISKPNIHDNKQEFLQELQAVEQILAHIDGLFGLLIYDSDESDTKQMIARLRTATDESSRRAFVDYPITTAIELVRKNAVEAGLHYNFLWLLFDTRNAYRARLGVLKEQETQYWNVSSRPPNYFARTIALRFARFYARQTGRRPTFGISKEGSFPSTDYGRLLEQIFEILEIKVRVRSQAVWAIEKIVEDDFKPLEVSSVGGLLGSWGDQAFPPLPKNPLLEIARQLKKDED